MPGVLGLNLDAAAGNGLTELQRRVASFPRDAGQSLFVHGVAGTGKSSALIARLAALLREGRRPSEILVLLPQRAHVERWEGHLAHLDAPVRGGVELLTFYSLAQRAVALFWPLVADTAGFAHPDREPTFLTIESAQYHMLRIIEPLMATDGYFAGLTIRRPRLLSQLLDNLNKAALVGFDHTDIYRRLRSAWTGKPDHLNAYLQAQDCAIRFRECCLKNNLLDFSLVTELYVRHLLTHPVYQRYFRARYRHLIADNIEENVPVMHGLLAWALPHCRSAVLAYDEGGGFRVFLGADAAGGWALAGACSETWSCEELVQPTRHSLALGAGLARALRAREDVAPRQGRGGGLDADRAVLGRISEDFWIGMTRRMAVTVANLVQSGVDPGEVAILAPYVSEVMRFAIQDELGRQGIAVHVLRPATLLRDDPAVRALITVALLAHPQWRLRVSGEDYVPGDEDVAHMLGTLLVGLDPVRARTLAKSAFPPGSESLTDLGAAGPGADPRALGRLWESVGYQVRTSYEALRGWIAAYRQGPNDPLDLFLGRLFGALLSMPGFTGRPGSDVTRACSRLVESAAKFAQAAASEGAPEDNSTLHRDYVQLILGGIASAEYLSDAPREPQAVVLATAYAYLTRDLRSSFQFWCDLGADGWWNRPNQPLTQPYVLSLRWPVGQAWRDVEEAQAERDALARVLHGLLARCTRGVYLAHARLGIDGQEQGQRLMRALALACGRIAQPESATE